MKTDAASRDRAGRALYEKGQAMLPGLGQPPAPGWDELEDAVRERWRRNAVGPAVVNGPAVPTHSASGDDSLPALSRHSRR